jgi:hypothetical protein
MEAFISHAVSVAVQFMAVDEKRLPEIKRYAIVLLHLNVATPQVSIAL